MIHFFVMPQAFINLFIKLNKFLTTILNLEQILILVLLIEMENRIYRYLIINIVNINLYSIEQKKVKY
jgi:hypothetical protein